MNEYTSKAFNENWKDYIEKGMPGITFECPGVIFHINMMVNYLSRTKSNFLLGRVYVQNNKVIFTSNLDAKSNEMYSKVLTKKYIRALAY